MADDTQPEHATIYSVAALAGVSIASVSRVLRGTNATSSAVRDKVLAAVAELDYVPTGAARSLAVRRSEAHGFVLGDFTGPYYSELLIGYEVAAAGNGQSVVLMVADSRVDPRAAVRDLAGRVDGLVIGPCQLDDETIETLAAKMPVVVVGREPVPSADAVLAENVSSARQLTDHLLEHRRTSLVFIGDPDASRDVRERYAGFTEALHGVGMTEAAEPFRVELTEASGTAVAEKVVGHIAEFDALVCANDELALALVRGLQQQGVRVPSDVAVVGWDDVMAARYLNPALSTVGQPVRELGTIAADLLHRRVIGEPVLPGPTVLPTTVVIRQSCGCADALAGST